MSIERPEEDIFYDLNPWVAPYQCKCGNIKNNPGSFCIKCMSPCEYIGDINARYKGHVGLDCRDHPLTTSQSRYFSLLVDGIYNDMLCRQYMEESTFLQAHLQEILNRICTECSYVKQVETYPSRYKRTPVEEFYNNIFNYLDYMLYECRYPIGERMIDTVDKEHIEEFHERLATIAAQRLVSFCK